MKCIAPLLNIDSFYYVGETSSNQECMPIRFQENMAFVIDESRRYESFPVTEIQQAYLIGREGVFELGQVACFLYQEYDFSSTFDIERLEQSWNHLIQRHETLRIIFPSNTEQRILKDVPYYTISVHDLDHETSTNEQLMKRREQMSHQIRPIHQWPLFDIQATRFSLDNEDRIRLHIGFDALILDYWSIILILNEWCELHYNLNVPLTPLKLSYRDYVLTEQQLKQTISYKNDRQYWINRLPSFPLGPNLPLQHLPNEISIQRHCSSYEKLDLLRWQMLKTRILDCQLTPAGFLASVYAAVLAKWNENKHFTLNLPVFNRLPVHPQINQIAGDFTSIVPLEINWNEQITFNEFAQTVQKQLWNDLEHMSYNGVSFIRDLMQMHKSRAIALPFVFTCGVDVGDPNQKNRRDNPFFDQAPTYQVSQTPQVFLDHAALEENGELVSIWIYVENLFPPDMIPDMHRAFIQFLEKLAMYDHRWNMPLSIALSTVQEKRRLEYNQTRWDSHVKDTLIHLPIIKQAERTPQAWAILSEQKNLTYQQLMDRVYSLAYHLQQQENGEMPSNQIIAILMKKGWEQVVACLAILITGAAYLPLDIDSPYDRICTLIEESNVKFVLLQSDCAHQFPHLTTISVDVFQSENYPKPFPIRRQSPTDLAYVIYTSGSTGKPKGVMINHQAVLNTLLDINSRLEVSTNDRIFALSHLNFDLSVYDIFGILIAGGAIVIPDHEQYKNPQHWYDLMLKHHITLWNSVPMLMQMLVEHLHHTHHQSQLRHILMSGDWIPLSLPKSIRTTFGESVIITSLGGATEASIWSIAFTIPEEISPKWKSIPYGTPLRNQKYYVYDTHLDDCPEWVNGDLYIGGVGLADGYWHDEEKTKSSFITHPLTGERLYRTGDQGRFIPDGYIEFMGRKDFQVKVHGHRIELGEIEYHLQQHSDIHQAVVTVDRKIQQLIGYVMPEIHSAQNDNYDQSEIEITDSIERMNFKLARHNLRHQGKVEVTIPLLKPKLTEKLINTYYARKSYRQFTNDGIDRDTIETIFKKCYSMEKTNNLSGSNIDFDNLSQLLAVLIPINISKQFLPKYRYASAGTLYPVQMYIELPTSIGSIPSGLYYHNPDKHSLDLVDDCVSNNIRLHLVGRSSAIAPLYGRTLGNEFCILETGYMIGLLQREASKLGLQLSKVDHDEMAEHCFDLKENDTHYCFTTSSTEQYASSIHPHNDSQCIIYLKTVQNNHNNHWFTYNKENETVIPLDFPENTTKDEMPLIFDPDDDTKAIFHTCQGAIFLMDNPTNTLDLGSISHLLMADCLEVNIGLCPIGTRASLPSKVNITLENILARHKFSENNLSFHTLLMGKITDQQKYERKTSKVRSMPDWSTTLRSYLNQKLPAYMVPSHFMTISSFPLSPNGKIDRNSLPQVSMSILDEAGTYIAPKTELEKAVASIWQEILCVDQADLDGTVASTNSIIPPSISTTTSFFDLGGDSLLLIQIYQRYQSLIPFDTKALTLRSFFTETTLADHARLLETFVVNNTQSVQWHTLHIKEGTMLILRKSIEIFFCFCCLGIASFAQERIFLDEQVRFSLNIAIYNELAVLRVAQGSLSMVRLTEALRYVLSKQKILRTALIFENDEGILTQHITNKHLTFTFNDKQTYKDELDLQNIIYQTTIDSNLFHLSDGRVFHCQILRQQRSTNDNKDNEFFADSDILIIAFHHSAFDRSSGPIFFNDLWEAYNNNNVWSEETEIVQYIDYSVHERLIDMTASREFWHLQLNGNSLERRLPLPVDRQRLSSGERSGLAHVARITFNDDLTTTFFNYASAHQVTPFQLGLAIFYTFLFKLTYGQDDLCIACLNANRYRTELQNMIGMFVATLPYRIQLDPDWSFEKLVEYVREKSLSILDHSHYPLQYILADTQLEESNAKFLETTFDFITASSNIKQLSFDGSTLEQVSLQKPSEVAKFDFALRFFYDATSNDGNLSFRFICSRDLFDETTVTNIARRLEHLCSQIFFSDFNVTRNDASHGSIAKLALMLPEEAEEIQRLSFHRMPGILAEGTYI